MVARVERALSKVAEHAAPFWVDVPAFTAFADEVQENIQSGELTYTARKRLLRRADHHRIRRFDANLIMAMVQNRAGEDRFVGETPAQKSWLFPLAVAFTVQAIILLSLLILVRG